MPAKRCASLADHAAEVRPAGLRLGLRKPKYCQDRREGLLQPRPATGGQSLTALGVAARNDTDIGEPDLAPASHLVAGRQALR